jgi:hypothetical protein
MIGDVLMAHRKVEAIRLSHPFLKVGQERREAALGILTHYQGMFLCTPKLVCSCGQQEVRNSTFSGCDGKQSTAFNEQHHCVCGGFDRKAVVCIGRTKQITGKIKSDDVAGPVLECLAMADLMHLCSQYSNCQTATAAMQFNMADKTLDGIHISNQKHIRVS